jgi:tetratricopeptide (TPR) repeat protein
MRLGVLVFAVSVGLIFSPACLLALGPKSAAEAVAWGDSLREKEHYAAAITAYTKALKLDPKCAKAYCGRGRAYGASHNLDKAIADLNEAIRLDPKDARAYNGRGACYWDKGQCDKALIEFDEAIRLDPKAGWAYMNRGGMYAEMGELDKATADLNEAVRLDPKNAVAYTNRAEVYRRKGDAPKAIADLTEAIRLNPTNAAAHENRADLHFANGEYGRAIADYTEVIRSDPKSERARRGRASAYNCIGDVERAITDLATVAPIDPKSPASYELRAVLRISRGDAEHGLAYLQTMMRLNPKDPAATFDESPKGILTPKALEYGRQQLRQMLKDRPAMAQYGDKAQILYDWAARQFAGEKLHQEILWDATEPSDFDATSDSTGRIQVSRTCLSGPDESKEQTCEKIWRCTVFELFNITNAGEFGRIEAEAAAGELSRDGFGGKLIDAESPAAEKTRAFYIRVFLPWAIEHHVSTNPELWYLTHTCGGRIQARLLCPKDDPHWRVYGLRYDYIVLRALFEKGDYNGAVQRATKMRKESNSEEATAWIDVFRAAAYARKGDWKMVVADSTDAIRLGLTDANTYFIRGWAYAEKDKRDEAIGDFSKAIELNLTFGDAYRNCGEVCGLKGEIGKAITDLSAMIRGEARMVAPAYMGRGTAYLMKGDLDKAIADYSQALRLDPKLSETVKPCLSGVYARRAAAYAEKHNYDRAIADLTAAKQVGPKCQPTPKPTFAYENDKRFSLPDSEGDLDSRLIDAYINRSEAYAKNGDWDRAVADLNEILRFNPKNSLILMERASLYQKKGDRARAIADMSAAIRLDPRDSELYLKRGMAHEEHGDLDAAIADFTEVIRLNRYTPAAGYCHRAGVQVKKGNPAAALADANAAIQSEPNCAEAYQCRARIHEKRGDAPEAKQDLARAKQLDAQKAVQARRNQPSYPDTGAMR